MIFCSIDDNEMLHLGLLMDQAFGETNRVATCTLPLLDFSVIKGKQRKAYFVAVQAGLGRNYTPMQAVFRRVVQASA